MKKVKILVIDPVPLSRQDVALCLGSELGEDILESRGIEIVQTCTDAGPESIESEYDEAMANPGIIKAALENADKVDAVVVSCMSDPAVIALRELLSIPVIGPSQAAMSTASQLGRKFGMVVLTSDVVPIHYKLAAINGFSDQLVEVLPAGIHVTEIGELSRDNPDFLVEKLGSAAHKLLESGADTIVNGCTGFLGCAKGVTKYLENLGFTGVPVVDPLPNAIFTAANMVSLGLVHSGLSYPKVSV